MGIYKSTKVLQKKKAMLNALEKSLGVVSVACKKANIDRSMHYYYLKTDPDYREKVEELAEVALDFAESSLHNQIQDGNTAATIFYLKTKGKKRGYIERMEITDKSKLEDQYESMSDEEIQAEIDRMTKKIQN